MEKPIISFIVPVYQAEKYLKRCISSILIQEIENYELILVDDGSEDNSGAICDWYANENPRIVVLHQRNLGQGAARNKGLSIAKGEWVCFIDNDDWIDSELYKLSEPYLLRKDVDMIMFARRDIFKLHSKDYLLDMSNDVVEFSSKKDLHALQLCTLNPYYPYKIPFGKLPISAPWGKIIRMSIVRDNACEFCESYGEDVPFSFNINLGVKKIVYINKALYNYYFHESSMRKYLPDAPQKYELSLKKMHDDVEKNHYKDIDFINQIKMLDLTYISYYVVQEFCHINNKKKYKERKQKFLEIVNTDLYKNIFGVMDISCLPFRRKILARLIKLKFFLGIEIMSKLNNVYMFFVFNK